MFRCKWKEPGRDEEAVDSEGMCLEIVARESMVLAVVLPDGSQKLRLVRYDEIIFDRYVD